MYEGLQHIGSEGSDQISENVDGKDDGYGEFCLESLLHAYDQRHGHREDCEEQFVTHTGKPAYECNCRMQKSENMYDSGDFQGLHAYLALSGYEDNEFAQIIQFLRSVHPEILTIRPFLHPVRHNSYARVRINVYFRELIIG